MSYPAVPAFTLLLQQDSIPCPGIHKRVHYYLTTCPLSATVKRKHFADGFSWGKIIREACAGSLGGKKNRDAVEVIATLRHQPVNLVQLRVIAAQFTTRTGSSRGKNRGALKVIYSTASTCRYFVLLVRVLRLIAAPLHYT